MYVRDKDAVNAAFMICEMFAYYKTRGISLLERLAGIYATYGYCMNTLYSYQFEGASGMLRMQDIMGRFRDSINELGGIKVVRTLDYIDGLEGLPKSDVIKYVLEDGSSVVIRPSGTEPKLKAYLSITAANEPEACEKEERIKAEIEEYI